MRNRTEDQIILAFIRHGETQANAQRCYLGRTDEPLSERGIQRLMVYREENRYPRADCLFTSPMKRCVETAGILYPMLKPVVIPEWEEMDFGRFEYKNYEELKKDEQYQRWIDSGGMADFPEGESREAFLARCESGFQRMCGILRQMQADRRGGRPGGTCQGICDRSRGDDHGIAQCSWRRKRERIFRLSDGKRQGISV